LRVFVSYRREDSSAHAGRLSDALARRLGERHVFQDVSAIAPGELFERAIDKALAESDAVLVLIGPRWLATGAGGAVRLSEPNDYVRREVVRALGGDLPVIPVLLGGASLPMAEDLPADVRPLVERQAIELRDEMWRDDMEALIKSIRGQGRSAPGRPRWVLVAGSVVGLLMIVGAVALVSFRNASGDSNEPAGAQQCAAPSDDGWTRIVGPASSTGVTVDIPKGSVEFVVTDGYYRPEAAGWEVVFETLITNSTSEPRYFDLFSYKRLEVDRFPVEPAVCFSIDPELLEPGQAGRARVGFEVTEDPSRSLRLVASVEDSDGAIELGGTG
jgi:hypothetical protein